MTRATPLSLRPTSPQTPRLARWIGALFTALLLVACSTGGGSTPDLDVASLPAQGNDEELMVIDCLLPAQVRKLGSGMTFLVPRKPVRTSARDCEIRGGEYVAYDRSNYATALKVWLPLAKEGDPKAQTYVGEIYEEGLGLAPDYEVAVAWYRKAAEAGYGPAQINLGNLYEQGLGVERDPEAAMNWYRQASGLSDLGLEFLAFVDDATEFTRLEQELSASERESAELRGELQKVQTQLTEAKEHGAWLMDWAETERIELDRERTRMQAQVTSVSAEREQLASERSKLEADRIRAEEKQDEGLLARLQGVFLGLVASETALAGREQELGAQRSQISSRESVLAEREAEIGQVDRKIESLTASARDQRVLVAAVSSPPPVALPGPSITLIDPSLPRTRGTRLVRVASTVPERPIIGQVEAPAGLSRLLVNGVSMKPDDRGLFETAITVKRPGAEVSIVAVDKQGKQDRRRFVLEATESGELEARPVRPTPPGAPATMLDFGRFHALLIGNNEYQHHSRLETAVSDVGMVAKTLRDWYGFEVTVLTNATRYQTLAALEHYRSSLTPDENLLVYYAGHGEIDPGSGQGYWLPVDATERDPGTWISNQVITEMLDAMVARHVMVVADSCYSGTLTRAAVPALPPALDDPGRVAWQGAMLSRRARTVLSSGGLAPVLDSGGGDHSVFAAALIETLLASQDVLEGQRLFQEVAARVAYAAATQGFDQSPRYGPIRHGGHASGEFFFVPEG